ncbi:MAG: glucosidase, partial [Acidobacteria bacterium]|nr:glucosidase [Acidobacteriota bacterium]
MPIERDRIIEAGARIRHWRRWGPYLSERQWATVREDYSPYGAAWDYFPHDAAPCRAYRWGEDGLCGICDNRQRLCFALALWNGKDPILKERLFGLTGHEGNHGEDVKEYYYYLDSTPTHSYMKCLYKYPQAEFPYARLLHHGRNQYEPELELIETGVFDDDRYWDVFVEYAKADADDILIRITAANRGPDPAILHLLPTVWFRNVWSWGHNKPRPGLHQVADNAIEAEENTLGSYLFTFEGKPGLLFTENDTNTERLYGFPSGRRLYKDAFHEYVVHGRQDAVSAEPAGTKACGIYTLAVDGCGQQVLHLRLSRQGSNRAKKLNRDGDGVFETRIREADEFYESFQPKTLSRDARRVQRQAFAGMLWSKQFYHYVIETWLEGDPAGPPPPHERWSGRNSEWVHLYNEDVISMPDKWEYPWYAAWDLAFHMIPFALIDPEFAKSQMALFLREWYM